MPDTIQSKDSTAENVEFLAPMTSKEAHSVQKLKNCPDQILLPFDTQELKNLTTHGNFERQPPRT
jgi:hypothetical protein